MCNGNEKILLMGIQRGDVRETKDGMYVWKRGLDSRIKELSDTTEMKSQQHADDESTELLSKMMKQDCYVY